MSTDLPRVGLGVAAGLCVQAAWLARAAARAEDEDGVLTGLGVVTYDADPGRLSAAFVWDLLRRVTAPRASTSTSG